MQTVWQPATTAGIQAIGLASGKGTAILLMFDCMNLNVIKTENQQGKMLAAACQPIWQGGCCPDCQSSQSVSVTTKC